MTSRTTRRSASSLIIRGPSAGSSASSRIRDSWEAANGNQLTETEQAACEAAGGGTNCRRRFDLTRKDIFHYVFFGHSTGEPKSPNPCLSPATGTNPDGSCTTHNPDFHVVTKRSGKGDRPGGDAIVTMGGWGNGFRGSDFVQASTMMHETGHHFWLTHSGNPFDLQTPPSGPAPLNPMEGNCNPNYLSIMSYSLQIDGLTTVLNPEAVLDFSRARLGDHSYAAPGGSIASINEFSLPIDLTNPMGYRGTWYAPQATVHSSLGTTIAKKHCDGTVITNNAQMIRITLPISGVTGIDWNGDLQLQVPTRALRTSRSTERRATAAPRHSFSVDRTIGRGSRPTACNSWAADGIPLDHRLALPAKAASPATAASPVKAASPATAVLPGTVASPATVASPVMAASPATAASLVTAASPATAARRRSRISIPPTRLGIRRIC